MRKTNDYGGQGLNRGNSMHIQKPLPVGVVYSKHIKMWLVRILKKGTPTTLRKFNTKEEAERYYKSVGK
jgi:hypothetical protein